MVSYVTRSELRGYGARLTEEKRTRLRKAATSVNATFLSHSSKDEELVEGAVLILSNHGATVYVDRVDPALPPYTSKETAATLKRRIGECRKFVMLASENSKESRWVPWELGIADGERGIPNIALFPAVEDGGSTKWTSWEYLGLYRRIVWGNLKGHKDPLWMVLDEENNTASTLSDWLRT
jgi:hypothetical protein